MHATRKMLSVALTVSSLAFVSAKGDGFISPYVTADEVLTLTGNVTIDVPAGTTNHIEFLLGGNHTISKTGGGCLEIGIITNTAVSFDVQAGSLSFTDPQTLTFTNTLLHLDASKLSSLTVSSANGTNYVSRWNDADGGSVYASTHAERPNPFLVHNAYSGRTMLDFGTMYSTADAGEAYSDILSGGYGAALSLSGQCKFYDYIWVAQDREEVKNLVVGGAAIPGPAAMGISGSHGNGGRGLGCNGTVPVLLPNGIANSARTVYYQNGLSTIAWDASPAESSVNVICHDGARQLNADGGTPGNRRTTADWIGAHGTGGFTTAGGLRIGEAYLFNRVLTDEERQLAVTALCRKWRGMSVGAVAVAEGANINLNGRKISAASFSIHIHGSVSGDGTIDNPAASTTNCVPYAVSSGYVSADLVTDRSLANPGYAFSGDGTVTAHSDIQIEYLSAVGALAKTGGGSLKVLALGNGVKDVVVCEGSLIVSPLANESASFHVDVSDRSSLTVDENADGTNYVTRIDDLVGSGNYAETYSGNISLFGTNRPVPNPFIASETANGLPLLDFGTFAAIANPEGYGAGMTVNVTVNRILTLYTVFKDHPEVKDYAVPEGAYDYPSGFAGPCPVYGNNLRRGEGGVKPGTGSLTHKYLYSGVAGSMQKCDYMCNNAAINYNDRLPSGLNVLANRASWAVADENKQSKLWSISKLGIVPSDSASTFVSGGLLFGETIACKYWQSEEVMAQTSAALMHKWKGTAHPVAYDSLFVAQGAVFRQDDADVTVGMLSGRGAVASPISLADGGTIELMLANDYSDNAITCSDSLAIAGSGVLHIDADWANIAALGDERSVKVVNCSDVTGSVSGWRVETTNPERQIRGKLRIGADGIYADIYYRRGFVLTFK